MGANPFFPEATLTPDIYWRNQPPAVRKLRDLDAIAVQQAAMNLAAEGYVIDVPIMVWKWDPVVVMGERLQYGYTWVPSGLMANVPNVPIAPLPSGPHYDPDNPPAGSIRVSINAADYPPFDPPPPPPPLATNIVGSRIFGAIYTFGPGAKDAQGTFLVNNGQQITQEGAVYVAQRSTGLMGETLYFMRQ